MKKAISLILALVLCLSLCACGGGNDTPETTEAPTSPVVEKHGWEYAKIVDEFGDEVADSNQSAIITSISGDFSNTATNSSELGGSVYVLKSVGAAATDWSVYFRLLEYGNNPITYYEKDELTLKIKVDDNIEEYALTGVAPNGDLRLGEDEIGNNPVYNYLYDGKDVRCVIYIGNSKYNFTIESDGFVDACVAAGYVSQEKAEIDSMDMDSIENIIDSFYLRADSTERNETLAQNLDSFQLLTADEISSLLDGYWITVGTNTYGWWHMYQFLSDGTRTHVGQFSGAGENYMPSNSPKSGAWSCENGLLSFSPADTKDTAPYQVRMLKEGYYILNIEETDIPAYLLIQANEDGTALHPYK